MTGNCPLFLSVEMCFLVSLPLIELHVSWDNYLASLKTKLENVSSSAKEKYLTTVMVANFYTQIFLNWLQSSTAVTNFAFKRANSSGKFKNGISFYDFEALMSWRYAICFLSYRTSNTTCIQRQKKLDILFKVCPLLSRWQMAVWTATHTFYKSYVL